MLEDLLDAYRSTRNAAPAVVASCMKPLFSRVENAILPGLTTYTWSSMNINSFIDSVKAILNELNIFTKQVC